MAKDDEIIAAQNETIAQLQKQMAELAARLPAPVEVAVTPGGKFPLAINRRGGKPGQIDHPGVDVITVLNEAELAAKLAEGGWQMAPLEHVYDEPEPVLVKKGKK